MAQSEFIGVRTAWHSPGDVAPIGHTVNQHLDLVLPNTGIQEARRLSAACQAVFPGTSDIREGMMWTNDRPGLGIDSDETLSTRLLYPGHPLNGAVQRPYEPPVAAQQNADKSEPKSRPVGVCWPSASGIAPLRVWCTDTIPGSCLAVKTHFAKSAQEPGPVPCLPRAMRQ